VLLMVMKEQAKTGCHCVREKPGRTTVHFLPSDIFPGKNPVVGLWVPCKIPCRGYSGGTMGWVKCTSARPAVRPEANNSICHDPTLHPRSAAGGSR
jgi:hypothetical protein